MFDKIYYDETRFDMKIHDCEFSYGYIYSGKDFDIKERLDYFDLESIVQVKVCNNPIRHLNDFNGNDLILAPIIYKLIKNGKTEYVNKVEGEDAICSYVWGNLWDILKWKIYAYSRNYQEKPISKDMSSYEIEELEIENRKIRERIKSAKERFLSEEECYDYFKTLFQCCWERYYQNGKQEKKELMYKIAFKEKSFLYKAMASNYFYITFCFLFLLAPLLTELFSQERYFITDKYGDIINGNIYTIIVHAHIYLFSASFARNEFGHRSNELCDNYNIISYGIFATITISAVCVFILDIPDLAKHLFWVAPCYLLWYPVLFIQKDTKEKGFREK